MKIAHATQFAADDIHSWSGLVYHLRRALQDAGCEVVTIDSLREKGRIPGKLLELAYKHLAGKTFIRQRSAGMLEGFARQVEAGLAGTAAEVVFSPSSYPIARLKPGLPTVFWTDASFAGMIDFYPFMTDLCKRTLRSARAATSRWKRPSNLTGSACRHGCIWWVAGHREQYPGSSCVTALFPKIPRRAGPGWMRFCPSRTSSSSPPAPSATRWSLRMSVPTACPRWRLRAAFNN